MQAAAEMSWLNLEKTELHKKQASFAHLAPDVAQFAGYAGSSNPPGEGAGSDAKLRKRTPSSTQSDTLRILQISDVHVDTDYSEVSVSWLLNFLHSAVQRRPY